VSRLSRSESQARTRQRLLEAASKVFARDGIQAATVEQIATTAGFTRGAFYSNFSGKDELVVTLLDDWVNRTVTEIGELFERDHTPTKFFEALYQRELSRAATRDARNETLLWTEFWLYALRNPRIRPRLAARLRALREATAFMVETQFAEMDVALPASSQQMAAVILALDAGLMLHQHIDPGAYPDTTFFDALFFMQRAVAALAREERMVDQ
jgi:AcrR family transcriptional regulator